MEYLYRIRNFHLKCLFLAVIILSTLSLLYHLIHHLNPDMTYCYIENDPYYGKNIFHYRTTLRRLQEVLLAEKQPTPGRTLFFHETTCHQQQPSTGHVHPGIVKLNARQACAIESAALQNPDFDVFVLFASPVYRNTSNNDSIIEAILSYPNVQLRNVDLLYYAHGKLTHDWLRKGQLFRSKYVVLHTSHFMRLITLWRWGGTHLDLDTIVVRSLEYLQPNSLGIDQHTNLINGIVNFEQTGLGRLIAERCLEDFGRNFKADHQAYNGDVVITRVITQLCGDIENNTFLMKKERCSGIQLLGKEKFHEISFDDYLFDSKHPNEVMEHINKSYVLHFLNRKTKSKSIEKEFDALFSVLAKRYCPKVYAATQYIF